MFDNYGRTVKDTLLEPIIGAIPRWIHPNAITVASLPFGVGAAVCAAFGFRGWALALFVINRILDGLDGFVARRQERYSDFGGYLDMMVDFAVYATVPIGVWYGATNGGTGSPWPLLVLLSVFYVNAASWLYLSALIEKRRANARPEQNKTSIVMPVGIVEGTETLIFYLLFLTVPIYFRPLFFAMAIATAAGVIQRMVWAIRELPRG